MCSLKFDRAQVFPDEQGQKGTTSLKVCRVNHRAIHQHDARAVPPLSVTPKNPERTEMGPEKEKTDPAALAS